MIQDSTGDFITARLGFVSNTENLCYKQIELVYRITLFVCL